jgi:hypothetical protein
MFRGVGKPTHTEERILLPEGSNSDARIKVPDEGSNYDARTRRTDDDQRAI